MSFWSLAVEEQFYLLWPLGLAVLLAVVGSPRPRAQADNLDGAGVLRHVLEVQVLRWVGARSYGIHLWHWPVILVLGHVSPRAPGTSGFLMEQGASVALTLAVSAAWFR